MQNLPQEVVDNISSFLFEVSADASLPAAEGDFTSCRVLSLATLSRKWQRTIESRTFRSLHIKSSDLDELASVLSSSSTTRLSLIKTLHVDILLPTYSRDACAEYETDNDRTMNNRIASDKISSLLQILSSAPWPSDSGIDLTIGIYSPADYIHRGEEIRRDSLIDIFDERFCYSYISLSDINYSVPCVRRLFPPQGTTRYLSPGSLVLLTSAFPRLEHFFWSHAEPGYFIGHRRDYQQEFANAVMHYQLPSTMKRMDLTIDAPEYPHTERLPDLVGTSSSVPTTHSSGSLCDALRVMLNANSSVKVIYYSGPIEPSLFWRGQNDMDAAMVDDTLSWTSVEEMSFEFRLASFSGQWYFKGGVRDKLYSESSDVPLSYNTTGLVPPGYGSAENTQAALALIKSMKPLEDSEGFLVEGYDFRRTPRDEAMLPLLEAFARRLATMPSLKRAEMEVRVDNWDWFITYHAPGPDRGYAEYVDGPVDAMRARVFMHTVDWRPSEEVMGLLRDVGRIRHGEDSIVMFLPFIY